MGLPLTGFGGSGVSILYLEPQYAITDQKTIGFRLEVYSSRTLFGLTGDHYLATSRVRPSLGLILGIYRIYGNGIVPGIAPRVKLTIYRSVISCTAHFTKDPFLFFNLSFYLWGSRY